MSRTATNRDWWLRLVALCVLAAGAAAANPVCTESPFTKPAGYCNFDPTLFLSPRLQPNGGDDFPTVHGVPLAVSQDETAGQISPAGSRFWRHVAVYGILALLAGAVAGMGILVARPYLRSLKQPGCPNCGSADIRISFPEGPLDWSFGLFSCAPYRCKVCYYRFHKIPITGGPNLVSQGPNSAGS